MTGTASPADRVVERRRAVALARHYREVERLSIRQIAARLGRSPATVKAYFYDPSDANKRPTNTRKAEVASSEGTWPPWHQEEKSPERIFFAPERAVQRFR